LKLLTATNLKNIVLSFRCQVLIILIIINLIDIVLFKVLKDTLPETFIPRRCSYREQFRVECLAQGHIDESGD